MIIFYSVHINVNSDYIKLRYVCLYIFFISAEAESCTSIIM